MEVSTRPHRQLAFVGWDVPLACAHTEQLHGAVDMRIELRAGYREVQLVLRVLTDRPRGDYWHRDAEFDVRIQLHRPPRCLVKGETSWWNMLVDDEPEGPFATAIAWALEHLEPDGASYDENTVARVKRLTDTLEGASRVVAGWAIEGCDPNARDRALRFSPQARMFVYAALVADNFGWVAQLAEVCPGLLVLVSDHERYGAQVLVGVRGGKSLAALLQEAVACMLGGRHRDAAVFIRRTPVYMSRSILMSATGAPGVDINDMPKSQDDLTTWFEWQAESVRAARLFFPPDQPRFGSFVSKHAIALDAIAAGRNSDRATLLAEISDWAHSGLGTIPSRRSTPARVVAAVDAWHASLWGYGDYDPSLALPTPPTATQEVSDFSVEPITTLGALFAEGATMHHCVASYGHLALTGQMHFYRAKTRGERVTIAIAWAGDRWWLVEASGFRKPSASQHERDPAVDRVAGEAVTTTVTRTRSGPSTSGS